MPEAVVAYWSAWNEHDVQRVPDILARAVTANVEWSDPREAFVGIKNLAAAIRRLRTTKPECRFVIASEVESHHDRLRYRWDMIRGQRTLMEGLDIVTLDASGLIVRVDGFFGHPSPIEHGNSGVPDMLRRRGDPDPD